MESGFMNIGRILKFLIAGIVIGAVLFFAGFGVINMLNKPSDAPVIAENQTEATPITPPTIEVDSNQNKSSAITDSASTSIITSAQQGTDNSPIKIKPLTSDSRCFD